MKRGSGIVKIRRTDLNGRRAGKEILNRIFSRDCAEYHIQASNQSYALYLDGKEILSFEQGAGNYDDSDIPTAFEELRVGWINYQSAPPGFTAWIDDIAFDDMPIGCD